MARLKYYNTATNSWENISVNGKDGASVHIGDSEPSDDSTIWIDTDEEAEVGGGNSTPANWSTTSQIAALIEEDMLPAVHNLDGKILTDKNGNVILRY